MTEVVINVGFCAPPVLRKRGRPKGHKMTVIGIPVKKQKTGKKARMLPFLKLHTSIDEKGIVCLTILMQWLWRMNGQLY